MEWHEAVGRAELEDGQPRTVLVGGHPVLLVMQDGTVHATTAICPHKYTDLSEGTLGDGCLTCPQHEATFDLRTGLPGNDESWAGRLEVYPVRVVDGAVQVALPLTSA